VALLVWWIDSSCTWCWGMIMTAKAEEGWGKAVLCKGHCPRRSRALPDTQVPSEVAAMW